MTYPTTVLYWRDVLLTLALREETDRKRKGLTDIPPATYYVLPSTLSRLASLPSLARQRQRAVAGILVGTSPDGYIEFGRVKVDTAMRAMTTSTSFCVIRAYARALEVEDHHLIDIIIIEPAMFADSFTPVQEAINGRATS